MSSQISISISILFSYYEKLILIFNDIGHLITKDMMNHAIALIVVMEVV